MPRYRFKKPQQVINDSEGTEMARKKRPTKKQLAARKKFAAAARKGKIKKGTKLK